jgi:hypothetical protein
LVHLPVSVCHDDSPSRNINKGDAKPPSLVPIPLARWETRGSQWAAHFTTWSTSNAAPQPMATATNPHINSLSMRSFFKAHSLSLKITWAICLRFRWLVPPLVAICPNA